MKLIYTKLFEVEKEKNEIRLVQTIDNRPEGLIYLNLTNDQAIDLALSILIKYASVFDLVNPEVRKKLNKLNNNLREIYHDI